MTEEYAVGDITKLLKGQAADTKEIEDFFGSKQSEDIVERKPKDGVAKKKEHKPKNDKRSQKRKREEAIKENESDNESEDEEDDKHRRSYDDIRTPHDVLDEDDDEDERPGKRAKTSEREWQKDTEKMARTVFVGNFPIRNKTLKVCYDNMHNSNPLASTETVKTHFQTIWRCRNSSYAFCGCKRF